MQKYLKILVNMFCDTKSIEVLCSQLYAFYSMNILLTNVYNIYILTGLLQLPSRLSMQIYTQPVPMGERPSSSNRRNLPHLREKGRAPTPGDIGPITYRGLTLTPMVTTVQTSNYRSARRHTKTTVYRSKPSILSDILTKKPPIPE